MDFIDLKFNSCSFSVNRPFPYSEYENAFLYNNCLISRALIGSFLLSIRIQTHKIFI